MADDAADAVAPGDAALTVLNAIVGWLFVAVGLYGVATTAGGMATGSLATGATSVGILALWFAVAAVGLVATPRFRRRFSRRGAVTRFGRARSVDERVVRPEENGDDACVACGEAVESGLLRRYRESVVLAGFPLYTTERSENHYCLDCATVELPGVDPGDVAGDSNAGSVDGATDPERADEGSGETSVRNSAADEASGSGSAGHSSDDEASGKGSAEHSSDDESAVEPG